MMSFRFPADVVFVFARKRGAMILLTRLNHQPIALNADLIKWIESSPDTVITLITGEKLVVLETCERVIEAVVEYRREFQNPFLCTRYALRGMAGAESE
jgi:uncharacterized protein YlzI (FlbEa/FlbD family)